MKQYLSSNYDYWQKGYEAPNVESFVFRVYGRILKAEFGIDGSGSEKLLDFGCGSGANLKFFHGKGFNCYGVDVSKINIQHCKDRMPEISDNFTIINPEPKIDDVFFGGEYDIVIAIQSLYYFSDADMEIRLNSLYSQMKKGAILYATMIGTKCSQYFENSTKYKDGLRKVDFTTNRLQVKDYFVNFTKDEEDLINKFKMFKPIHIGYYDDKYREDEGNSFHYTFVGKK